MTEYLELFSILKELHTISGFRISVHDTEKKELCAYPKELTGFCNYIQNTIKGKRCCKEYDFKAFEKVKETGQTYIYQCSFGLYEAVSPLYHFGVLSGYLMMGQTIDDGIESARYVCTKGRSYIKEEAELNRLVNSIPISSREKILSCISILKICASYITFHNDLKPADKELSSRLKIYLNQHYASKITLDSLCREFYLSKATLTSSFRSAYQQSIMEYLNQIRLEHAKKLLEDDTLSMKMIASSCGFSDQNYFTKVFQKYCKVTPREFRKSKIPYKG